MMTRRNLLLGLAVASLATEIPLPVYARAAITGIDTHAHVFTRALPLAGERRYAPGYDAPIADYLAMLDRNGMSHGVLVQPSFLGTDNSYMLEALRTAPERLRGIAVVAPEAEPDFLADLGRQGVVGIRLNLIGRPDPDFGALLWKRHLARLAELGWQVEVQVEAHRLPALLPPLLAVGLPIVVDHFGRPDPRLGIDDPGFRYLLDSGAAGRVWVKLSAAYRNNSGAASEQTANAASHQLLAALGPKQLLWGSDWPHTQFETSADPITARRSLDVWVPEEAARRTILVDTPARLFRFSA
ncbi:amidohydrolase 2 [Methylobacterium sp. 4-46]|uniref:amidohydrolase family protein n=1 Tax=unclassified Methylobacterium TaxID=2615210 RepID=UPI000152C90D|nr:MULTISPECIES: amidohydrolase family protein [Methylobacterium]ACA15329.1 amidohydrolase 2 [Methylobacterium sp. 4-46]WFT81055.1 amidohydrolase family protein [Methylobacterium nodulans]